MDDSYDVIVLGVGAMGASACYHLARRGVKVLGLERFGLPHALGSSGGQTRLIRKAYFEHADYVPLLQRAYENWDTLAERTGTQVLYRTGCLYLGRLEGEVVSGSLKAAGEHNLTCEQLSPEEARARFPAFRIPDHFAALFEPEAGFVLCERAVGAFAEQALRDGATLRANETVRSWSREGAGVRVVTDRGTYRGAHLVVTAGAWSGELLGDLGVELQVTRQVLGWVQPEEGELERFALGPFPCWVIEHDDPGFEGIYYGFPALPSSQFDGERGLKVGHHFIGPPTDPNHVDRRVAPEEEEDFRPALRTYLPGADGPTLAAKVCMYTATPDRHFVIGPHPEGGPVTLACGFSGHGFKFSSVVGEALADLSTEGATALPMDFLSPRRFTARHRGA